jgi:CBS domain-containing protein
MLQFDFSGKTDDRPYITWDGKTLARNPITVSMAGKCVRQLAYHYRGEPKHPHPNLEPVKSAMTFAVGTAVHEALQRGIVGLRDVERVVWMKDDDLYLEGRIDGIVPVTLTDGTMVNALLEMKTMNPYAFSKFKEGVIDEAYLVQANTYVELVNLEGDKIKHILWVAIDRATLEIAYSLRPFIGAYAMQGVENVALGTQKAPEDLPRLETYGSKLDWQCAYCPFWQSCWPTAVVPDSRKVELRLEVQP